MITPRSCELRLTLALLASLAVFGCDSGLEPPGPSEIVARSPLEVARRPGALVGPFVVQVLGPTIQGSPGRNGFQDPVAGVPVTFEFEDWQEDALALVTASRGEPAPAAQPATPPAEQGAPLEPDGGETSGATQDTPAAPEPRGMSAADAVLPPESRAPTGPQFLESKTGDPAAAQTTIAPDGLAAVVTTDENGYARIDARLGRFVGDFRIQAEIRNQYQQRRRVEFLVLSGVEILDAGREAPPGSPLPVTVQVWRVERGAGQPAPAPGGAEDETEDDGGESHADEADATPDPSGWVVLPERDRTVYFTALEHSRTLGSARLEDDRDKTNSRGIATTNVLLGDRTGAYHVFAELAPSESSPLWRGVTIEQNAFDWWELIAALGGGAALFVVGLRLLASGLIVHLSPVLHLLTGGFTRNRLLGFAGGTAAGCAFHSSTTVVSHLVSFANGGLLVAAAATGQILGANLGKTLLLQFIAFDAVTLLSVPLVVTGTVLLLLPSQLGSRTWGMTILGGGLTLLGWEALTHGAALAAFSPSLLDTLASWDPGIGSQPLVSTALVFASTAFVAMLLVLVVRSSNLAMAFAMAFVARDMISFQMVVAILIGSSIGSAASLLLGSLRRSREARRLALIQTLSQVFGGVWLTVLTAIPLGGEPLIVCIVDWVTPGKLFHPQPENVTHHVAVLYTLFHLANGVLFMLVNPWLLRVTHSIVPRDPVRDDIKPYRLDPNLVSVPSFALAQATREVSYMGELVRKVVAESFDAFRYRDLNLTDQIARREESVSIVHGRVTQYLLRVGEHTLAARDAVRLETLHVAAGSFTRIADMGEQLCHLTVRVLEEKVEPPEDALREITELFEMVISQFENVFHLLEGPDPRVEENAMKVGERVAKSASRIENLWLQKLRPQDGAAAGTDVGVVVLLTRQAYDTLAQIAGQLTHIAERARVISAR